MKVRVRDTLWPNEVRAPNAQASRSFIRCISHNIRRVTRIFIDVAWRIADLTCHAICQCDLPAHVSGAPSVNDPLLWNREARRALGRIQPTMRNWSGQAGAAKVRVSARWT